MFSGNSRLSLGTGRLSRATGWLSRVTGRLSRVTGRLSRATGRLSRTTRLSRATGRLSRATDRLSRATGRLLRATGRLSRVTGRLSRATGRLSCATGRLSRATGRLSRATGRLSRATGLCWHACHFECQWVFSRICLNSLLLHRFRDFEARQKIAKARIVASILNEEKGTRQKKRQQVSWCLWHEMVDCFDVARSRGQPGLDVVCRIHFDEFEYPRNVSQCWFYIIFYALIFSKTNNWFGMLLF